jgi:hypothetical protein
MARRSGALAMPDINILYMSLQRTESKNNFYHIKRHKEGEGDSVGKINLAVDHVVGTALYNVRMSYG